MGVGGGWRIAAGAALLGLGLLAPDVRAGEPRSTTLDPPAPVAGQRFAGALATDTQTLVVGSPGSNAVFVHRHDAGAFELQRTLTPPADEFAAEFGRSVDVAGEWLVVGAQGAAFVYRRSHGDWALAQRLSPPEQEDFGDAVSIWRDWIAVGAPEAFGGAGAVHVFAWDGGDWLRAATVRSPEGPATPRFGDAVALDGGFLVVGAPGRLGDRTPGSAFAFARTSGAWQLVDALRRTVPEAEDRFGVAVDLDGSTAIVGAPGSRNGTAQGAGDVFLFRRIDRNSDGIIWGGGFGPRREPDWRFEPRGRIDRPEGRRLDGFGSSIDCTYGVLVVGQPGDDAIDENAGAAFVYPRSFLTDAWDEVVRLDRPNSEPGARFGSAVASAGWFAVVGAPSDLGAGTATVFDPVVDVDPVPSRVRGFLLPRRAAFAAIGAETVFRATGTIDLGTRAVDLGLAGRLRLGDAEFRLPSGLRRGADGSWFSTDDGAVELRLRSTRGGGSKRRFELEVRGAQPVVDGPVRLSYATPEFFVRSTLVLRDGRCRPDRGHGHLDGPELALHRLRARATAAGTYDVGLVVALGSGGSAFAGRLPVVVEIGDVRAEIAARDLTSADGAWRMSQPTGRVSKLVIDPRRWRLVVHLRGVDLGTRSPRRRPLNVTVALGPTARSFDVLVGRRGRTLRY